MNGFFQTILTYSILTAVGLYTAYKLFRIAFPKKEETLGCSSGCGCDAVKLKREILEARKSRI
jgi:hypothetical protein